MPVRPSSSASESSLKARRRRSKAEKTAASLFGSLPFLDTPTAEITWNRISISREGKGLSDEIRRDVVWELIEGNFRFELVALDHALAPQEWKLERTSTRRDCLIRQVFADESHFVNLEYVDHDLGLAASELTDRLPFLEALLQVMLQWKGAELLKSYEGVLGSDQDGRKNADFVASRFMQAEIDMVCIYCQLFFDTFFRLPTIPHQRPSASRHVGISQT
ncbi:hypothetical protein C8J56DRAFT_784810 [Mycena floridula]|nr:hypothetical protein C8J56DRAFT_784810 [Mycena floridula]